MSDTTEKIMNSPFPSLPVPVIIGRLDRFRAFIRQMREVGIIDLAGHLSEAPVSIGQCLGQLEIQSLLAESFNPAEHRDTPKSFADLVGPDQHESLASMIVAIAAGGTDGRTSTPVKVLLPDPVEVQMVWSVRDLNQSERDRLVAVLIPMAEEQVANAAIQRRDQLLEAIAETANTFFTATDVPEAVSKALPMVARAVSAASTVYYRMSQPPSNKTLVERVSVPLNPSHPTRPFPVPEDRLMVLLNKGVVLRFPAGTGAPENGSKELNQASEVWTPLIFGDQLVGAVRYIWIDGRSEWLPAEIDGLNLVARLLAAMIRRHRSMADISNARDRLDSMVQAIQEGLLVMREDGKIVDCNTAAGAIFSRPVESLKADPEILHTIKCIDREAKPIDFVERCHELVAMERPPMDKTIVGIQGTGARVSWLMIGVVPWKVQTDGSNALLVTCVDVTLRETVNQEQLLILSSALRSTSDAIAITATDGVVIWANKATAQMVGARSESIVGRRLHTLLSGVVDKDVYSGMLNAVRTSGEFSGQVEIARSEGDPSTVSLVVTPLKGVNGETTHFVALARDVSTEVRLQKQLMQSQKLESLGTLAGGIAHDFNNVLGIIRVYMDLVRGALGRPDEATVYVDKVNGAVERAAQLVRRILLFSRKQDRSGAHISLMAALDNISEMARQLLPKSIQFILDHRAGDVEIPLDAASTEQVILNLIVNAKDAMKSGGTLTVSSRLERPAGLSNSAPPWVVISVSDTGHGIDNKTLEKIWDPFFTTKPKGQGTGLGLPMVQSVVSQQGGRMEVQSEVGKGTTFSVHLPVAGDAARAGEIASAKVPEIRPKGSILIVEDEEGLRIALSTLMSRHGLTVFECENGKEALRVVKREGTKIAAIISDADMPVMNGVEFYDEIRKTFPSIPFIMASGALSQSDLTRLKQEGLRGFLPKPYTSADVMRTLNAVLEGRPQFPTWM